MTTPLADLLGPVPQMLPGHALREVPDAPLDLSIEGRGRLLSIDDVHALLFGTKSIKWIKRNVIPEKRIVIGHLWCWWESDIRIWLDSRRGKPSTMRREHTRKRNAIVGQTRPELRRGVAAQRLANASPSALATKAAAASYGERPHVGHQ